MKKFVKKDGIFIKVSLIVLALSLLIAWGGGTNYVNPISAERTPIAGNYFIPDYETKAEAKEAGEKVNEAIAGEGSVLLKNEDNALPLGEAKISLFGKSSADLLHGGSGAGSGSGGTMLGIHEALREVGFSLNPALVNFYNDNTLSGPGRGNPPGNPNITSGYNTGETPVESYTDAVESTYADYNDAALVVFSRIGGEGFDLPRTMTWNGESYGQVGTQHKVPGARSETDHYLQLDENEAALLKYVGGKFDKVVVLLNTGSQFECGFLDDPNHYGYHENIKAALWIGYPGRTGLRGMAGILKGDINPSGKTVDTWARDFKADPTWENFGNNLIDKGNQYSNKSGYYYVDYEEGIYVGYRYWETRGHTEGTGAWTGDDKRGNRPINGTSTTEWNNWYDAHVVYPFGHGLSYTTFDQTIVSQNPAAGSAITADTKISVTVKVTNTGNVAGKDVVQLYYTSPYKMNGEGGTGGIEKAHVVLGGFGKTSLLAPGASEDVTITMKGRDMASYDFSDANRNGIRGYELEEGTYTLRLMANSHDTIASTDYKVAEDIHVLKSDASETDIVNRFDDVSAGVSTYLSRGDWTGTYPAMDIKKAAPAEVSSKIDEWKNVNSPVTDDEQKPYYTTDMPVTGDDTGDIMLADLIDRAYDDPLWDQFLNQLSVSTMINLVQHGGYVTGYNVPGLGIPQVKSTDGCTGWTFVGTGYAFYGSETVLASTWNRKLAYDKGRALANEGLFGDGSSRSRYPGIYAPGVNIHRSPFGGRNFEYYSEDGFLTGELAAQLVLGAKEKGLFCYVKHFAVNDQETNRSGNGITTWGSEQSLREIYLKGFEITVKKGETTAVMTANNRIGAVWTGGSYALLTNVLRNEWGFRGAVVTDYVGGTYMNPDMMIRAGGNIIFNGANVTYDKASATTVTALRNAAHGICYTLANSMAMNTGTTTPPAAMNPYNGSMLKTGVLNVSYTANLATATLNKEVLGNDVKDSDIKYALKAGSTLPEGLTLSESGILSGSPTQDVNSYSFTVVASYDVYSRQATFIISIIDANGSIIYTAGESADGSIILPPAATVGEAYSFSVATAKIEKPDATEDEIAAFPTIYYALKNGSRLPEGLTLTADGVVSGTPSKECKDYAFTVVASARGYRDRELTWTVSILHGMTFEGGALAAGKYGVSYAEKIGGAVTADRHPVRYELAADSVLPSGLVLTKAGYVTGTPKQAVTDHKFTVLAVSDFGFTREAEFTVTIGLNFNDTVLASGKEGVEYSASVANAQGTRKINYSFAEGSDIPEGLTLAADGTLSGTPAKAGVYKLVVKSEAEGLAGDQTTVTLYIANAAGAGDDGNDNGSEGCNGMIGGAAVGMVGVGLAFIGVIVLRKTGNGKKNNKTKE